MKVAIIGAGLAGRVLAWRLNELDQGVKITLIDQYDRNHKGTGLVAAAMIAPYTEAVSTEAITQELGAESHALWAKWLPELEAKTQHSVMFNQEGTIVVSHPQDEASWQRFNIKAKSVVADDQMQSFNQQQLQDVEPELAQNFNQALFFKNEGVINNQALYPALNDYFDAAENIEWYENTKVVFDEEAENGKLTLSNSDIKSNFDYVFDCRGNDAKAELSKISKEATLRSVRGEVVNVYAPEVNFTRSIRLMHPRYPLYIAPRGDHQYVIGATQLESSDDGPMTVRSGLELLSALYSLHKGFAEAQILDMLAGLRPTFNNNLPQINTQGKLIHINGLFRHGYLFAPILVNDLIKQLFDKEDDVRFPRLIRNIHHDKDDKSKYQQ